MPAGAGEGAGLRFLPREQAARAHLELPCGQCPDCRLAYARDWAIRCLHEAQLHEKNAFITLTYNPEHLPRDLSVDVEEWKRFAKRLRKAGRIFRYLAVGEYGDENLRPHYHALLFGENFDEERTCVKIDPENGMRTYHSASLEKAWPFGFAELKDLHPSNVNYVSRYAMKKVLGSSAKAKELREQRYKRVSETTGEIWQVKPEFAVMSRGGKGKGKGGLGSQWYEKFHTDVFPGNFVVMKGKKTAVPRYYKNKLKKQDPELAQKLKVRASKAPAGFGNERTHERRLVKEKVTETRVKQQATRTTEKK